MRQEDDNAKKWWLSDLDLTFKPDPSKFDALFDGIAVSDRLKVSRRSVSVADGVITKRTIRKIESSSANETTVVAGLPWAILEKCRSRFVEIAKREEVEYGLIAASEILLKEYFELYGHSFGDIVQHIYMMELGKGKVILSLLKYLSSKGYMDVYPYGQMVAMAALAHENIEVREAGIRSFEAWEHVNGKTVLSSLEVHPKWLDDYRKEVLQQLESLE